MLDSLLYLGVLTLTVSGSSLPGWEELQCEEGHKYLFSDTKHTWQDAREECELYGGWLLSINSLQEQNCLVRYAQTSGLHHGWFWHDGKTINSIDRTEDPQSIERTTCVLLLFLQVNRNFLLWQKKIRQQQTNDVLSILCMSSLYCSWVKPWW